MSSASSAIQSFSTQLWQRVPGGTKGARLVWLWHAVALLGLLIFLSDWKPPWELKLKGPITASLFKYGISVGLWWGAVAHVAISVALLATVKLWSREPKAAPAPSNSLPLKASFWVLLGIILIGALWLRLPRMDLSYWGDEGWSARYYTHGLWKPAKGATYQDALTFEKVDWRKTLWDDHTGGNHYGFSAASRLILDGWRVLQGLPDHAFSEWLSRLPPLVAGIGSLVAIALFLSWLGSPRAGLLAALLLAIHPWHIRYSTEARGYSLMLFFFILTAWALMFALRDGRWRGWLLFSAATFFTAWCWKLALVPLLAMNGLLFVAFLLGKAQGLPRWLVANLTAGALFVFIAGPGLAQSPYVTEDLRNSAEPMGANWVRKCLSTAVFGTPWKREHPLNPVETPVADRLAKRPLLTRLALGAEVLLLVGGAGLLMRRHRLLGGLMIGVLLSAVIGAAAFKFVLRVEWINWYSFFVLLPLVVIKGTALDGIMSAITAKAHRPWLAALVLMLPGVSLAVTAPQIRLQMTRPFEDLRGAFELTRGKHEPWNNAEPTQVRTCYLWRHIALYDPRGDIHVRTADELRTQMAAAKAERGELYFVMGPRALCETLNPDLLAVLDDPLSFEKLDTLWVERGFNTLEVFHYLKR